MTTSSDYMQIREDMRIDLPEGEEGAAKIVRFEINAQEAKFGALRAMIGGHGRGGISPGRYTKLLINGNLWMSDTRDEMSDHLGAIYALERAPHNCRVLISGLGLGMVVKAMLHQEKVEHVDVVELNEDVINLVGPHYEKLAADLGKTIHIIHGDAMDRSTHFTKDDHWAVVWHDIWLNISADNWDSMKALHRRYGRYADWQDSWCRDRVKYAAEQDRQMSRYW